MESHLLQMRGLKLRIRNCFNIHIVASFTDAWIETNQLTQLELTEIVASFTDAWIETSGRR